MLVSRWVFPKFAETPLSAFLSKHKPPYRVERKYDGERLLCRISGLPDLPRTVSFENRHAFSGVLPKLAEAVLAAFPTLRNVQLDAELVTGVMGRLYGDAGFLKHRNNREALTLIVFDIQPYPSPLNERLQVLRENFQAGQPQVQLAEGVIAHNQEEILAFFKDQVRRGAEGVVVKPLNSYYADGTWVKIKQEETEDLVILGVRKTEGYRSNGVAESFLVGQYDASLQEFKPLGHVASGLSLELKAALSGVLLKHQTGEDAEHIYVEPFAVIEVAHNGRLPEGFRHPKIVKIRSDKSALECEA